MFEQLTQLVQQFGQDDVVNNAAVPNEHNEAVMGEASSSILSGLQKMLTESGGTEQLAGLLKGGNVDASNPVVQKLTEQLTGNLGQKFGLSTDASAGVAGSLIPKVLGSLMGKANDPNESGFQISDIISAISGGAGNAGLMDAVSKYGTQFGLDQNADGKVDMSDAMEAVSKKGGFGSLLGKLFGK